MAFVVAAHVALLLAIWHLTPARQVLSHAAPVIVRLLAPDPPLPPERRPPPPPPKALPKVKPLDPPPPRTYAPPVEPLAPAPAAPITTVAKPPPPAPPVEIAAPPAPAAPPAAATPPRFDADYLNNPAPAYPPLARRNGEQGRVLLRVLVAPDGRAQDVVLKASSGHERLDRAAIDAVRQWRFVPARLGAEPVAAWVVVPIAFSLGR